MTAEEFLARPLYHGSSQYFDMPDPMKGRELTDFGRGFYVTTSYQQAEFWARRSLKNNSALYTAYVYEYSCPGQSVSAKLWTEPCEEWLMYISANRRPKRFDRTQIEHVISHDIVIGPVADDDVGRVVESFLTGIYGDTHSAAAIKLAIDFCMTHVYKDQACFKSQYAVDSLKLESVKRIYR